jgi:1,2-dihydroxy-3-keto-5-methylthiopentene dioxygenase
MTRLIMFDDAGRGSPISATDDAAQIAARLATLGVGFERVAAPHALPEGADGAYVLKIYREEVERLKLGGGFHSLDVFRLMPATADRAAVRAKYLTEHVHDDAEVRFFVEGGGTFYLRAGTRVAELRLERADLLRVPAGTRHWFDAGNPPFCTAIRMFTRPEGWVGVPTGDAAIVGRFAGG